MLSDQEQSRYSKQMVLPEIGIAGQEKLAAARVLVIGAGGLGCPVLQYLAAAGVGHIGIVDGDRVDISNLQRQVLYTTADIGLLKAEVAAAKLDALNPNLHFHVYPVFADRSNILDFIKGYDIIVDGSDNFATRYLVNDACVIQGRPLVSGAIYKFEGQVTVLNYNDGPTYRCIFPEPPAEGESPNCADIGVVATLPGIIGTMQANEVIKMITGVGAVLSGKLLVLDTLTMQQHIFQFKPVAANKNITQLPEDASVSCAIAQIVTYDELQMLLAQQPELQLVDVREMEEHYTDNIGGVNIPLSAFAGGMGRLSKELPVAVYCASGVRSSRTAQMLLDNGFATVYDLKGGMYALSR